MKLPVSLCFAVALCSHAQTFDMTSFSQPFPLAGMWKYHAGDDLRWADPDYDDFTWRTVPMPESAILAIKGRGWYRLQVRLPRNESSQALALLIGLFGNSSAYEVYVNGERLLAYGNPGGNILSARVASPMIVDLPRPAATLHIAFRVNSSAAPHEMSFDATRLVSWIGTRSLISQVERTWHLEVQSFLLPLLLVNAVVLTLAVVFILIGAWHSDAREYLWLGLYFVLQGAIHLVAFNAEGFGLRSSLAVNAGVSILACLLVVTWTQLCRSLFHSRWTGWAITWTAMGCGIFSSQLLGFVAGMPYRLDLAMASLIAVPLMLAGSYYEAAWRQSRQRRSPTGIDVAIAAHLLLAATGYIIIRRDFGEQAIRDGGIWREVSIVVFFGLLMMVLLSRRTARVRVEQLRLKQELEAGAEVQTLLLPSNAAHVPGFSMDAVYLPASEVGGDFYYALTDREALVVLIGDVSGKGLRAAMIVTLIIGVLRDTAERQPGALLHILNRALAGQMRGGFVTCCAARFQADGQVIVANAGHLAPYVDGREAELDSGLPLGLTTESVFTEASVRARTVSLVSDGVVEAANGAGELFGFDRTRAISTKPAKQIAAVAKNWGQNDDITVVTVRRVPA